MSSDIEIQAAIEYRRERDRRSPLKLALAPDAKPETITGWRANIFSAAQLQHQTFPPVSYCVPDLIPEGLTIIAGKPKIGKSWLALDVCIAVAAGRFCLGERKPIQGDVLYAAMEDNPRRLQRRIDRLLSPVSASWPERLTLTNSRLDKGGVDDIRQWVEHSAEPRLIVLDALTGVKPIRTQQDTRRTMKASPSCIALRTKGAFQSSSYTIPARWKQMILLTL